MWALLKSFSIIDGPCSRKKETEVSTIDKTVEDSVCQSAEKTIVGEGEVSDIGTSKC